MPKKLLIIVSLILANSLLIADSRAVVDFKQGDLETDLKITHPVKSAKLTGDDSHQLILIGENSQQQSVLAIFRLNNQARQFSEISRVIIPDHFLAYDILETPDKHKMIFLSSQALLEFDLANNQFKTIVPIQSIYQQPKRQFLEAKNFIKDINGDKLDDILITDFLVTHLFLQNQQGGFDQQSMPVRPKIRTDDDSATFTETPIFFADLNRDQKDDMVVVRDAGLTVYFQNGNGSFKVQPHDLSIPIDVHALNWWEIRESDGQTANQNEISHRTMDKIVDLNNDQVADLLIRYSKNEGVLDRKNNYEIYFGKMNGDQISYNATPDSVISSDGTIAGIDIVDVDGDEKSEIMVASLDIGVSQIIGALLSGSIDQDIYLFKMNDNGQFDKEPNVDKEVEISFSLSSGKSGAPVVKLADFDGDGLKDLMFSDGQKLLRIYQGASEKKLFKRRSSKYRVQIPKDGNLIETADLNNDGKQDVIIRYGRQDDAKLTNKLVFLFAI